LVEIYCGPVAFIIGGIAFHWITLMAGAGVILYLCLSLPEAKRIRVSIRHFYSTALLAVVGGVACARFLYVLTDLPYYSAHPGQIIGLETLGASGIMAGGIIAVILYSLISGVSFWQSADVIAIGSVAGIGVSSIGCIPAGCGHGTETLLPWAFVYINESSEALVNVPLHPVQLYFVLWCLVVTTVLCIVRRHLPVYGTLALIAVFLCLSGDFTLSFIRAGMPIAFGLQWGQMLSLLLAATALILFIVKVKRVS